MVALCIALALVSLTVTCIALLHVRNSKEKFTFIYRWGILLGSFVWEDLLVFSFALFLVASIVLIIRDIRIGLLGFGIFWVVRSAGEALYFFLQQFHEPTHSPHEISSHLSLLRPLLGDICDQKGMIIMQVFWQTIVTISACLVILLLINWVRIPAWF
jgi:hypothetical protein